MLWGQVGWVGNNSSVGTEPGPNLVKGRKYRCCMCETSCGSDGSSDTFGRFLKIIVEENTMLISCQHLCRVKTHHLNYRFVDYHHQNYRPVNYRSTRLEIQNESYVMNKSII